MLSEELTVLQESEALIKACLSAVSGGRRFYELSMTETVANSTLYGALRYIDTLTRAHVRGSTREASERDEWTQKR